jgi:hypothetical protein
MHYDRLLLKVDNAEAGALSVLDDIPQCVVFHVRPMIPSGRYRGHCSALSSPQKQQIRPAVLVSGGWWMRIPDSAVMPAVV